MRVLDHEKLLFYRPLLQAILVVGMTLFLVSNRCQSFPMFVSLYMLPITVCLTFLFVSYATAIMVTKDGRNPFFVPAWVKGVSLYFFV